MEAYIQSDFVRRRVKVWLYERGLGQTSVYRHKDGEWTRETVDERVDVEPTLHLPEDALAALVKAGSDFLPPSAATDRHLKDAIDVRDRALTLIERLVP